MVCLGLLVLAGTGVVEPRALAQTNRAPVAQQDFATLDEDRSVDLVVTANDSDPDGDVVRLALSSIIEAPTLGTAVRLSDTTVRYTPFANVSGSDRFRYRIHDGRGLVASTLVFLTINPVNDPPVGGADSASVAEDSSVTIAVTANDSDVDGDVVTLISSPVVTPPAHGTAVKVNGSSIVYTPHANYSGGDSFQYEAGDNRGGRTRAWVTISVIGSNDPPVAQPDSAAIAEDTPVTLTVTANDFDPDGVVKLALSPILEAPTKGTATRLNDSQIRYTPHANAWGSDQLRYRIVDGAGAVASALVTISIAEVNDAPTAVADSVSTPEDQAVSIVVTANDSDVDGDTLSLIASPVVTPPARGTATKLSGTTIRYTPNANTSGSDSFQYEVGDNRGARSRAWVTVNVVGANDPPVAVPDAATTNEDTAIDLAVTANDSDPDGEAPKLALSPILEAPAKGTATRLDDFRIRYVPHANAHGGDQLRYRIVDGAGAVASALVTLTIVEVNDAPLAVDDAATTQMSTAVTLTVTANDSDVDGDAVTLIAAPVVTPPAHGTAVKLSGSAVSYTPATGFAGSDAFEVEVGDGRGGRARSWARVTVAQEPSRIRVTQAWDGVEVAAGSTFHFPDGDPGVTESRLFRIHNDGAGALEVRNHLALVGGACFSQVENPAAVVPAGGSTTFRVRLLCATAQRAAGTVSIETNDPATPAFGFALDAAVGLPLPPLRVLAPDGSEVPHEGVFTLPETAVGVPVSRLFTLVNEGAAPLALADPDGLVSGTGFSEIEVPETPIPAGGQTAFRVRLLHAKPGSYDGQVVIEPVDRALRSYRFALHGEVGEPDFELSVDPASRSIERGKAKSFALTVTPRFGFSSTVALAVSGVPAGASAWWTPQQIASGTATLTVATGPATPLGSYPLTLTATGGGRTHSLPATVHVWQPASTDFGLDLSPDAATVVRGGSVQYSVSLAADTGFSGTAALSLAGLPAGASHTIEPSAIGNGGVATITVATLPETVEGSYELTVSGTAGSVTRTALASLLVRAPAAPGEPVVDSITPELFDGGGVRVVSVFGSNFQDATVSLAEENPDADSTGTRIFPTVVGTSISADGRRIDVSLDTSDGRVMDFYNLVIDNGVGDASTPSFRVVPAGPVVDLVTPNRPEPGGGAYVLTLAGYHLRNARVHAEPSGILELIGVEAQDDRHINGLLRVPAGAPTGPVDLVVTDPQGRVARITVEVVPAGAAQAATRELTTRRIDPQSLEAVPGAAPRVFFQEMAVRRINDTEVGADGGMRVRAASLDRAVEDAFTFQVYLSYTVNLFQFYWARAFVFDPETGQIGDAILQGLGLGQKVRFGAFVLSFYLRVDLTIEIYIGNTGFTWPRFCIEIHAAVQIPGFDGFVESWSYCRGGQFFPFNTGSTSSMSARGGDCATVTQEGEVGEGLVFAELEQRACCHQPIEVAASGQAFTGAGFAFDFALTTPNAANSTPGAQCQCSLVLQPGCVVRGANQTYSAVGNPGGGTYQWQVVKGGDRVTIAGDPNRPDIVVQGQQLSQAADDVTLQVTYTLGGGACSQTVDLSVVDVVRQGAGNQPLLFRAADGQTLDPRNAVPSQVGVGHTGLPALGMLDPGENGSSGFHNNMEVQAKIEPCVPGLRCDFNFRRDKDGVRADFAPGLPPRITIARGNDDLRDDDEDLMLDPAPDCTLFALDSPGIPVGSTSLACPHPGGVAHCFNFQEWLEIDGVRVDPPLPWHSSVRFQCLNGTFQRDGAGSGNSIGQGLHDCSVQTVSQP